MSIIEDRRVIQIESRPAQRPVSLTNEPAIEDVMPNMTQERLHLLHKYWNAANYLTVGQIYLQDNPLLKEPLRPEHIKPRLLGHWGTSPGLSFIYVHLNRLIQDEDVNMIYLAGPGHGGPAIVANVYLEGTYTEIRVSRHPMAYASREGRCLLLDGRDSRGLLRTGFSAEERVYALCVRKVSLAVRKKRCSMKDFQNKVAVVTGAASGIGRALSGKSAQEGMKVVLADIEESARKQAEEELTASGAQVVAVRTDVSQAAEVESLAQLAFATYGAVHLLCNNAGVVAGTTVWESSLADWQWVLGVNLWGVIYGLHSFVPRMLAQGGEGHIVNTASAFGLFSSAGSGLYKVSKQGVVTLSETLALELAARGAKLKVSVLCPEWVNTRISDAKRNRPQALQNAPEEQHLSPEMVAVVQAKRQLVQAGLAPSQVAEMVFDAIGQEKFYILTHPPHTKQLVQLRMQDILQERMPTDTAPDLFQFSQEAAQ